MNEWLWDWRKDEKSEGRWTAYFFAFNVYLGGMTLGREWEGRCSVAAGRRLNYMGWRWAEDLIRSGTQDRASSALGAIRDNYKMTLLTIMVT